MHINPAWVYRVNDDIAIEDFGERSLALRCVDLRLVELNATARNLLARLDGQANLGQVATAIARDYGQPLETVLADVQTTIAHMAELGIVARVFPAPEEATPVQLDFGSLRQAHRIETSKVCPLRG